MDCSLLRRGPSGASQATRARSARPRRASRSAHQLLPRRVLTPGVPHLEPIASPRPSSTWNVSLSRRRTGRANQRLGRLRGCPRADRFSFLALAVGLAGVTGCSQNHYDEKIEYPVRTDFLVAKPAPWGELIPPGFNRPGMLPLDAIRLPETERPAGIGQAEPPGRQEDLRPDHVARRCPQRIRRRT